jgi:hypothetical protein
MSDAKHGGGGGSNDTGLFLIIGLVVLAAMLFGFSSLFQPSYINLEYFFNSIADSIGFLTDPNTWYLVGAVSAVLSIFFIGIIIFCLVRMYEIQQHEQAEIAHEISLALAHDAEREKKVNPRWRHVLGMVESRTENDWRMAIIEADSMLDDLLQEKGYSGTTLGERLNAAQGDGLGAIRNAWEAHEVRNKIAHAGSDFPISQLEARRTIRLYETVFEEFRII